MSKKSRRRESVARTRIMEARERRARERQRKYWIAAGAVGLVLLLILGAGLVDAWVIQPASPIALVNGKTIRTDTYQKYVRYIRASAIARYNQLVQQRAQFGNDPALAQFKQLIDQNIQQAQAQIQAAPQQAFDTLVDSVLIAEEAQRRNLRVSEQEVQQKIEKDVAANKGYLTAPDATATAQAAITATATAQAQPSPTPTATFTPAPTVTDTATITPTTPEPTATPHIITQDEFKLEYTNLLTNLQRQVGWSEDEYRQFVRDDLLRRKLQDVFATTVPTTTEQIHARHILVDSKEQADSILDRLKKGESFEALAKELSKDASNKDKGGDLGWFPRGQMVKSFEDAAWALKPNEISGVLQTEFGYHIIQLLEGPTQRELDANMLRQRQSAALTNWLSDQKDKLRTDGKLISYYSPAKDPR